MQLGLVKLVVRLQQDDEGYPPAASESMWAEDIGGGTFRIDNIPFFATDLSLDDLVRAQRVGEDLTLTDTVSRSGHSTIRMVFFDRQQVAIVRAALHALGCKTELSHLPSLVAIDVPPDVAIQEVRDHLDDLSSKGVLDYEEAAMRHPSSVN
jgi:hypothetical protein